MNMDDQRTANLGMDARTTHSPCELVISHHMTLGSLGTDIQHIKQVLDNGLNKKLDDVKEALHRAEENTVRVKADLDQRATELTNKLALIDANSWLLKLLTGGLKKGIIYVIGLFLLSGLAGSTMWMFIRTYYFQESPGQIKHIADTIQKGTYYTKILANGSTVITANDPDKPAYILDADGKWSRAPQYRVDR